MKKIFKRLVIAISWHYVKRLRKSTKLTVIGVAGSLGKSGTKRAIAKLLSEKYRVQWQDGNYNDIVSVPLVFFGLPMPSLMNPLAWLKVFRQMSRSIKSYEFDVVVVELGTDGPGQISDFARYVELDICVVTLLAPEHIEQFGSLQAVAKEELSVQDFSKKLIFHDEIPKKFPDLIKDKYQTYGTSLDSTARFAYDRPRVSINIGGTGLVAETQLIGEHQMWGIAAASLVAHMLELSSQQIENGISQITPMSGRMQILAGIKDSLIIDDSYNANAEAMIAALDTLYQYENQNKIAVLGNMNELGTYAGEAHRRVGSHLDAKKIKRLYTIGPDANKYLATVAEERGIETIRSSSPYEIGELLEGTIQPKSVILFKGSQNGVFLEEAIKAILENPADKTILVRQSPDWITKKTKAFTR